MASGGTEHNNNTPLAKCDICCQSIWTDAEAQPREFAHVDMERVEGLSDMFSNVLDHQFRHARDVLVGIDGIVIVTQHSTYSDARWGYVRNVSADEHVNDGLVRIAELIRGSSSPMDLAMKFAQHPQRVYYTGSRTLIGANFDNISLTGIVYMFKRPATRDQIENVRTFRDASALLASQKYFPAFLTQRMHMHCSQERGFDLSGSPSYEVVLRVFNASLEEGKVRPKFNETGTVVLKYEDAPPAGRIPSTTLTTYVSAAPERRREEFSQYSLSMTRPRVVHRVLKSPQYGMRPPGTGVLADGAHAKRLTATTNDKEEPTSGRVEGGGKYDYVWMTLV